MPRSQKQIDAWRAEDRASSHSLTDSVRYDRRFENIYHDLGEISTTVATLEERSVHTTSQIETTRDSIAGDLDHVKVLVAKISAETAAIKAEVDSVRIAMTIVKWVLGVFGTLAGIAGAVWAIAKP